MPELPEVECLTRAVSATISGYSCRKISFFRDDIREPIPKDKLLAVLVDQKLLRIYRRSKYLLLETSRGTAIVHLGMTGNLLALQQCDPQIKHTHVVFTFKKGRSTIFLHYVDPRRFGRISALYPHELAEHSWFSDLGPEPLETAGLGAHLFAASRRKSQPVKAFLMDPTVVVGVGNIYACEALFASRVNPLRKASELSLTEYQKIASAIRRTLKKAIKAGGTTFRDFRNSDGSSGYFAMSLQVYNRSKKPCLQCGNLVNMERISGRSTFYCPFCQI